MKTKSNSELLKYSLVLLLLFIASLLYSQENYYWVGGSGNWSDYENHWATSSGGSEFHSSTPTSVDDVFFDENSFTDEGQVVTLDISGFSSNRIHNLDWRGSNFSPSLVTQIGTNNYLRIHGSTYFHETMTVDVVQLSLQIIFSGTDAEFDSGGIDLSNTSIGYYASSNCSLSFLDSISAKVFETANTIAGYVTTNGHPIHVAEEFTVNNPITETGTLDISNSKIYAKSFEVNSNVTGDLDVDGVSVDIIYPGGTTKIRQHGSEPLFPEYLIKEDHGIASISSYAESSFDKLTIEPGVELAIWSSLDNGLEVNDLFAEGTSGERISFISEENGELATLTSSADEVIFNNIDFKDMEAVGGASFNAFRSNDLGNVTGINFLKLDQVITFDTDLANFSLENIGDVIAVIGSSDSGLEVTYSIDDSDVAIISGSSELVLVGEGNTEIIISQEGNEWYNPSESLTRLIRIGRLDQTIMFDEIENQWVGNSFININASVDSGLPLTYNVTGPATLNGQTLEFNGVGTVQVTASHAGNDNYKVAESVMRAFEVYKETQIITFSEIVNTSEDAGFVNLDANSDSGLPVTYSVVGPGEVVDGTLEFTGNGMIQVTAKQEGNDLYLAAENIRRSFEILASETEKPLFLTQPEGLGLVYPNPVADYLYFDPQLKVEAVQVSDLSGKVFFSGELKGDHIDVSSWDRGNYILVIRTTDGDKIATRIVRN